MYRYAIKKLAALTTGAAALAAVGGVTIQNLVRQKKLRELHGLAAEEDHAAASMLGREWLGKKHEETTAFIRSEEGRRILENGSDEEIGNLLLSLSGALQEEVAASEMDPVKKFKTFPSLVIEEGFLGSSLDMRENNPNLGHVQANAFRISSDLIMTNKHVSGVRGDLIFATDRGGPDVAIYRVSDSVKKNIAQAPILHFTGNDDTGLLGARITVAGNDRDEMSLPDGTKRITSLMVPATPHVINFLKKYTMAQVSKKSWEENKANSYIILLHSGTWMYTSNNRHVVEAAGMSGSPALFDNGDVAGIISSRIPVNIQGVVAGIGFIHAAPRILAQLPEQIKTKLNK